MTRIDEELNRSLSDNENNNYELPVKEVFENNELVRVSYNGGDLEIDIKRQELNVYHQIKAKSVKYLVDKFKELGWI